MDLLLCWATFWHHNLNTGQVRPSGQYRQRRQSLRRLDYEVPRERFSTPTQAGLPRWKSDFPYCGRSTTKLCGQTPQADGQKYRWVVASGFCDFLPLESVSNHITHAIVSMMKPAILRAIPALIST